MSSPYTKDLELEVTFKLQLNDVFLFSKVSAEWVDLVDNDFWRTKFIRDFGARLPNGIDYEVEYLLMNGLTLNILYRYTVYKNYIKLLAIMLSKWKMPKELLSLAAYHDHLDIIKLLLDNGASIDDQGYSALISAVNRGNLEIVKLLLANGADIHAQEDYALISASRKDNIEIVKLLLANEALIHAVNYEALIMAAQHGKVEVVKLLLANGADIHAQGDLALILAAKYGNVDVVEVLLANGADVGV